MHKTEKIPKATITRLSFYYRQLELLEFDGYRMVSSEKLAWLCQVNPAQVRKDLGYFGEFGVRGVGYDVRDLQREIKKILAVNRNWNMGIVGIGNLGSALLQHQNFPARGFNFVAAFDSDKNKIGKELSSGLLIKDIRDLKETVKELKIEIGVITTPPSVAQGVADIFLESQVNAILNFSPTQIHVPETCLVENIDFTVKLDILTYKLKNEIWLLRRQKIE
jgi:redox-sensing transcriptional repressor